MGSALGMVEIVSLRDLYNKKCQTSSCTYQTGVTLDINPDGKGLCDFHRHSDRLSFLAWLEGSKGSSLQMLAGSRVFPGEQYQNNQAWAAALATELSFYFPFISVVQTCCFEDLPLWAGAVAWMEMVQTLKSLSVNKLFETLSKNTWRNFRSNITFKKMSFCFWLPILTKLHWSFAQHFDQYYFVLRSEHCWHSSKLLILMFHSIMLSPEISAGFTLDNKRTSHVLSGLVLTSHCISPRDHFLTFHHFKLPRWASLCCPTENVPSGKAVECLLLLARKRSGCCCSKVLWDYCCWGWGVLSTCVKGVCWRRAVPQLLQGKSRVWVRDSRAGPAHQLHQAVLEQW